MGPGAQLKHSEREEEAPERRRAQAVPRPQPERRQGQQRQYLTNIRYTTASTSVAMPKYSS